MILNSQIKLNHLRIVWVFKERMNFLNVKKLQFVLHAKLAKTVLFMPNSAATLLVVVLGLSKNYCRTSSYNSTDRTLLSYPVFFMFTWNYPVSPSLLWIAMKILTQGVCLFGYCSINNLLALLSLATPYISACLAFQLKFSC